MLETLPKAIGKCTRLRVLYVDHNKLEELPKEVGNLFFLEELNAEYNRLITVPSTLGGLVALQSIRLKHNKLEMLPYEIGGLETLDVLDCSENDKLHMVPEELRDDSEMVKFGSGSTSTMGHINKIKQGGDARRAAPGAAAAARREEPPPRRLLEAEPEPMRQEPLRASRESVASSERPAPAWEDEAFADDFRRRPQHQRALRFEDRRDAASRRERDAKKQSELRLRCAGLSRSVRELGDSNALKEELELATTSLSRAAAADESGAARTARKKMEDLRSDVADARRREKRAVELGAALRKRVAEERQRAEDAEASAAALEAALGAVTKDATPRRRGSSAGPRPQGRPRRVLAEKARAAAQREQELVDQLAEQRKRHGKQRRDLRSGARRERR
ncbi:hypothetical protein JL722_3364 [Aureococcus anophagefferens]|nr:hypothetical protein JL722_3364 [Aureococcus anophagefferens]